MEKTIPRLALFGGPKAVYSDPGDLFKWPIITEEDEQAVLEVLRAGKMSGIDVTMAFEEEFGGEISDEDAQKITTIGEAVAYLEQRQSQSA